MTTSWKGWGWKLGLASWLAIGGAIASLGDGANAQIKPDSTLGAESSVATPKVINGLPSDQIDGGARRGANLFHSFQEFNVGSGRAVFFTNPSGIENILSRVTGANPSNILGTLGVLGGNANLFLINPNGIIFGPNARLSLNGSFVGTTANAIGLANGNIFSANPGKPLPTGLLNVNPNAFFFNQIAAQPIINRSIADSTGLQVPPGRSLLLVGGDVRLEGGRLLAPGGRVDLGGVAGTGTVGLRVNGSYLGLSFPDGVQLSNVSLTNGADVKVRAGGGGSIAINAQNLNIADGSSLRAGIDSGLGSIGSVAGDIEINATGAINLTNDSFIANEVRARAVGKAGDINITAGSLSVMNGTQLGAVTSGQGDAGSVNINASDTVTFDRGDAISTVASTTAVGNAGGINITTGSLALTNGAQLAASSSGQGDVGSVNINARNQVSFDGVGSDGLPSAASSIVRAKGVGNAGGINITTRSLSFTNGAGLLVSTFGQGNAGSVNINARDTVSFNGVSSNGFRSSASSSVAAGAVGNGGGINITTGSLALTNGAQLTASTFGRGDAGSVNINARDTVSFDRSVAFSSVKETAVGKGGSINITTGSLALTNGAALDASTSGRGDAGSVNINARNQVSLDGVGSYGSSVGVFSIVKETAVGKGGGIDITTGSLSVKNGAFLSASTFGRGDAGSVNINARDQVSLDGVGSSDGSFSGAFSQVVPRAVGNGGAINITTGSLSVMNGAMLSAGTFGHGDAGSLTINARDTVSFDGVGSNGFSSGAFSSVAAGAVGKGGGINITTGSLALTNGALLSAVTSGQGDAGSLNINAHNTISFDGVGSNGFTSAASSSVRATGVGKGGGINITTGSLALTNGAFLSASTMGQGDGGNITLNANTLEAVNGGQVLTTSLSSGKAGDINLNVTDSVTLSGSDRTYNARIAQFGEQRVSGAGPASGLFANTARGSTGNGGTISIDPIKLTITDGAGVGVNSQGQGNAGNLLIQAGRVTLDRGGFLSAVTTSGEGGNMTLQVRDLLLMRNNSSISATAGGNGKGGNIFTDMNNGFLVAVPSENSDITANANQGQGGNVRITSSGIFGTQYRPRQTGQSDITASSDFGVNGVVNINTLGIDPGRGLVNLPVVPVDVTGLIAQGCPAGVGPRASKFVVTGRGGLPDNPSQTLSSDTVWSDLRPRTRHTGESEGVKDVTQQTNSTQGQLVEAQGWVTNAKGEVVLTASAPTATLDIPWLRPTTCHAP